MIIFPLLKQMLRNIPWLAGYAETLKERAIEDIRWHIEPIEHLVHGADLLLLLAWHGIFPLD